MDSDYPGCSLIISKIASRNVQIAVPFISHLEESMSRVAEGDGRGEELSASRKRTA